MRWLAFVVAFNVVLMVFWFSEALKPDQPVVDALGLTVSAWLLGVHFERFLASAFRKNEESRTCV